MPRQTPESEMKTRSLPPLLILVPGMATLLLGGCANYTAGGPMQSLDLYTYESMPDYPQTVKLTNTTTGETLWSMDIPVGQKLVVQFKPVIRNADPARPDIMYWDVMPQSVGREELDNAMPVPPSWERRLDVSYRTPGEAMPPPGP